jgi:cytochrome c
MSIRNNGAFISISTIAAVALLVCASCNSSGSQASVKFRQYYLKGEQLYTENCSNCHQKDGRGLRQLYPPLDSSDFMEANLEQAICIIKYGRSEQLTVNGKVYEQPMPGFINLSDLEIAEITTYIYNSWSNKKGLIEVKEASKILQSCN